jgi:signal peptidase II
LSEPSTPPRPRANPADIRVGSTPNALLPVSVSERSLAAGARQWLALAIVVVAAIVADQATKELVRGQLALGERVEVAGPLSIHHVQNPGIAFGLFASATSIVILLTAVAVVWMVVFFARSGARHPVLPVGLGLVLGGSLANLLDRIRLGHVTDFLDLTFWPAFNLADAFIVTGVGILLALLALAELPHRRNRSASRADDPAPRS